MHALPPSAWRRNDLNATTRHCSTPQGNARPNAPQRKQNAHNPSIGGTTHPRPMEILPHATGTPSHSAKIQHATRAQRAVTTAQRTATQRHDSYPANYPHLADTPRNLPASCRHHAVRCRHAGTDTGATPNATKRNPTQPHKTKRTNRHTRSTDLNNCVK